MREYYEANADKVRERHRQYYEANADKARERNRQYYKANADTLREYQRQYRKANPNKAREYSRQYRETDPDKVRKQYQKYYAANADKARSRMRRYYATNADKMRERSRQYHNANPDKARVFNCRRRTRKANLPDTFTAQDWEYALTYFNGCCAVCGRQLNDLFGEHTAAMDHWIPLSSGDCPGTVPGNIIPLCHGVNGCNNSKHAKDPETWLTETYGTRKARQIMARIQAYFDSLGDDEDAA